MAIQVSTKEAAMTMGSQEPCCPSVLDSLASAVLFVDNDTGRICLANQEALRILGYSQEEICVLYPADISASCESTESVVPPLLANPPVTTAAEFEWLMRHKNGNLLWTDARAKKVLMAGRWHTAIDLRDITARKAREEHSRIVHEALEDCGSAVLILRPDASATYLNPAFGLLFGYTADRTYDVVYEAVFADREEGIRIFETVALGGQWQGEIKMISKSAHEFPAFLRANPVLGDDYDVCAILFILNDLTERLQLETQVRQSQNLKAIGQLAAGIAHEINTPVQYVGDNIRFLRDSFSGLLDVAEKCTTLVENAKTGANAAPDVAALDELLQRVEIPYLREEMPLAFAQSIDGIGRVCEIVRAMRQFTHIGSADRTLTDLNQAIQNTVTVARNEWKYVADVETIFDEALPQVPCFPGEFNQVMLNLIVNAAHAIADVVPPAGETGAPPQPKGLITIRTFLDGDWVEIHLQDTGTGIPVDVRDKVFNMFFTTKEVGKGTGQGLAICYAVVVEKHGGTIAFDSEVGKGTTFKVRLPLHPERPE